MRVGRPPHTHTHPHTHAPSHGAAAVRQEEKEANHSRAENEGMVQLDTPQVPAAASRQGGAGWRQGGAGSPRLQAHVQAAALTLGSVSWLLQLNAMSRERARGHD